MSSERDRFYGEQAAAAARHAGREQRPGIEWGTVELGGVARRAYRDNATGTISYLNPPANYGLASYALAATFREDSASDARKVEL